MNKRIVAYLNELFPDARCELEYHKDYELLIAIMLSAQTKDERVNQVTRILNQRYPSLNDLANANIEDIKSIIKSLGNYNKKAANVIGISKSLLPYDAIPNDRELLESLPGVGHKTANVFLAMIYHEPCFAVDTHVARVSKRLGICKDNDDPNKIEMKLMQFFKDDDVEILHHQLVLFGRYHCKAIKPDCLNCKLKNMCRKYLD